VGADRPPKFGSAKIVISQVPLAGAGGGGGGNSATLAGGGPTLRAILHALGHAAAIREIDHPPGQLTAIGRQALAQGLGHRDIAVEIPVGTADQHRAEGGEGHKGPPVATPPPPYETLSAGDREEPLWAVMTREIRPHPRDAARSGAEMHTGRTVRPAGPQPEAVDGAAHDRVMRH
jgi:hypothetical protein